MGLLYPKLTGMPSRTSWWWPRTSMTNEADARDADVFVAAIMYPRKPLNRHIIHKNDPHDKHDSLVTAQELYYIDAKDADLFVATIMYPGKPLVWTY